MRFFLLLWLCSVSLCGVFGDGISASTKGAAGTAAINTCYREKQLPIGFLDNLIHTRKVPSTPVESCFIGCVYRELGLTRNGGLDIPFAKRVAYILYGRFPNKLSQSLNIVNICGAEIQNVNDECNLGYRTRECFIRNSDPSFAPIEAEVFLERGIETPTH